MRHEYLIRIAESSCVSPKNIGSLVDHLPHAKREKLLKSLHTGMQKPVDQMPLRPHRVKKRFSQSAQKRFRELTQIRDKAAEQLDLEPSFIAGRALLISLAEGNNSSRSELMQWQRELLKTDGEKTKKISNPIAYEI
jgi:ribonuclease D